MMSGAANPPSKLMSVLEENLAAMGTVITLLDRRYWAEGAGLEFIQQLALPEDGESIKVAIEGSFFAISCFSAVSVMSSRMRRVKMRLC